MPTKVLVFESDPAFAGELRTELGRLGLVAQVVDDGNAGLLAAASERPDLILLSIELPRMNGFSVCNKLKKDPALKDVPLIIMSSESSDETFEQHRKLRTRAEDYVHKPIAFGELLEHMRPYVALENGVGPSSLSDDAIIIDDEIELDVGQQAIPEDEGEPSASSVDAEVEAFADDAFDRLLDEPAPAVVAPSPSESPMAGEPPGHVSAAPAPMPKSSAPPRPAFDAEVERLRGEVERQKAEFARVERELSSAHTEIQRLEEAALADPGSNDQIVRLQREIEELRQKGGGGGKVGGVSSREFLDLREALNKKDKEILGLRDQIGRKEKDLLDASDAALALERDKADLEDRIGTLEKDLQGAKVLADTAKADKEQAAKRAEDFKTRGEKTKAELEMKLSELATVHKKHEGELGEKDAEIARLREQHEVAQSGEREAHRAALESALREADEKLARAVSDARESEQRERDAALSVARSEAETEKARALSARDAELTSAADARFAALLRSKDDEEARLQGELSVAMAEAASLRAEVASQQAIQEQRRQSDLDALRGDLEAMFAKEREDLLAQAAAERADLASQHSSLLAEVVAKHTQERNDIEARAADVAADLSIRTEERETLAREVARLKDKLGPLEAAFAATTAELAALKGQLAAQTQRLDAASSKWQMNRASLEQAKD
ncbi:MAG TPA: response regulator, partial [Polyangiaceae bacterium]|nr:response regulator [Polyangiaceae bacterium]